EQTAFDPERFSIVMALFPARAFDLRDGLVDQNERSGEIPALGHALGQNGFEIGTANATTAPLPDGECPLQQSCAFRRLAFPDQGWPGSDGHQAVCDEGQAVFATYSIGLFDTLEELIGLAEIIEELSANG